MSRKQTILKGTFILTVTGFITRFMGFFYRIFLSRIFGEEGVGLYQLVFPVFALGFSISSAGVQLALSRSVSKYYALCNKKRALEMLYTSILLSTILSLACTLILQKYASVIAENFLHNADTTELLLLLSYAFPFASIHSCITGYYFGLKLPRIPAMAQLLEQTSRILSVFIFYMLSIQFIFEFKIIFAVSGLLIGEIASCLFCLKNISGKFFPTSLPSLSSDTLFSCAKELFKLASPVTASRVLLNILQSIEAASIPASLILHGMSQSDALSTYGVLTGMALPCILFPSALTNAVSTMLLPTVAEIQALKNYPLLKNLVKKAIFSCTFMGILCCIAFLLFGNISGKILFNSTLAGQFIMTLAWICPFLYTNNTLIGIINGIGNTFASFLINGLSLSIRIICVFFIIPSKGIYGYLIGLLLSQVFVFISAVLFLFRQIKAKV